MAGKRQHFVPQFLQSGFVSNKEKKQVHVYKKGGSTFIVPTSKIGLQNNFYTTNEIEADSIITDDESLLYSRTVAGLRLEGATDISRLQVAQLLSHLTIRSRAIRDEFCTSSDYLLSKFFEAMKDREWLIGAVRRRLESEPSIMAGQIETLRTVSELHLSEEVLKEVVISSIDKAFPQIVASLAKLNLQDIAQNTLKPQIKKSHIEAIIKSTAPPIRVEALAEMDFDTLTYESNDLILGDTMVFYRVDSNAQYKILPDQKDDIKQVYLPLASNKMLVGTKKGVKNQPIVELKKLIAQCSVEFFISNAESEQNSLISSNIGEYSNILPINDIDTMISNLLLEL